MQRPGVKQRTVLQAAGTAVAMAVAVARPDGVVLLAAVAACYCCCYPACTRSNCRSGTH